MQDEKTKVISIVSFALIGMMFLLLIVVLGKWLFLPQTEDQNLLIMVVQAVVGMCIAATNYWLGSSDGSKRKDELIKQQTEVTAVETVAQTVLKPGNLK